MRKICLLKKVILETAEIFSEISDKKNCFLKRLCFSYSSPKLWRSNESLTGGCALELSFGSGGGNMNPNIMLKMQV